MIIVVFLGIVVESRRRSIDGNRFIVVDFDGFVFAFRALVVFLGIVAFLGIVVESQRRSIDGNLYIVIIFIVAVERRHAIHRMGDFFVFVAVVGGWSVDGGHVFVGDGRRSIIGDDFVFDATLRTADEPDETGNAP